MLSVSKKKKITGTLANLELLECTICYNSLTNTVYQCEFGHCVCEHCWPKLGYKCPTCQLPLGVNRCNVVERLVSQTVIRCPNVPFCGENVAYTRFKKHILDGCVVSKCYCPNYTLCNEKGDPDWIVDHFLHAHWPTEKYKSFFEFDTPINVDVITNLEVWYLFCWNSDCLFAYQCFKEEKGVWLDVTCIAPPASDVYHFSYVLLYTHKKRQIIYACTDMTKKGRMCYGYPNRATAYFIPKNHLENGELNVVLTIS